MLCEIQSMAKPSMAVAGSDVATFACADPFQKTL
jgi:hypothetical protein